MGAALLESCVDSLSGLETVLLKWATGQGVGNWLVDTALLSVVSEETTWATTLFSWLVDPLVGAASVFIRFIHLIATATLLFQVVDLLSATAALLVGVVSMAITTSRVISTTGDH